MPQITLTYPKRLFARWKRHPIYQTWYWEHPGLFDARDLCNAKNQHHGGYHFAEWFTAVHFWKKGYKALPPKYALRSRGKKFAEARKLLGPAGMEFLWKEYRPDLLVFDREHRYFFFVEVKPEGDRLKDREIKSFRAIEQRFACPVFLANLKPAR
jgi:hypothetical protein